MAQTVISVALFMTSRFASRFRLALLLIGYKVGYVALLSVMILLFPLEEGRQVFHYSGHVGSLDFGHLMWRFGAYDGDSYYGNYYLSLSELGYKRGSEDCAFYPLYPLLIRWISKATGGNDVLIALVLSNTLSLVAFLLFFQLAARRYGKTTAGLALVLLLTFPGSLFFQLIYSESLFFLLLMLFCLAVDQKYVAIALIAGFLMPLTRAVGFFCVFPLLWKFFVESRTNGWCLLASNLGWRAKVARFVKPSRFDSSISNSSSLGVPTKVILVLAPCMGLVAYFCLMWFWTGDPFEGIKAQKRFGVQSFGNLLDLGGFVIQLFNPTAWHAYRGSVLDRCAFILMIYCFPLIWRLDKSWCVWAVFLGVVPAVSGGFTSYTRFAAVVYPLFIGLAVLLIKQELRWWRLLVITTFVVLQSLLIWRFVTFGWTG